MKDLAGDQHTMQRPDSAPSPTKTSSSIHGPLDDAWSDDGCRCAAPPPATAFQSSPLPPPTPTPPTVHTSSNSNSNAQSHDKHGGLAAQTRVDRLFGFAQIFFLSLIFMSSWETMGLNLYAVFLNGGPSAMAWGVVVVVVGVASQAASLAEMSSIKPIAGAQYHWTFLFAPERYRNFITWMQGWITWFAWISTLAGIANTTASLMQALIRINYPDSYTPQRYHVTLIIFALMIVLGLINIYLYRLIPWVELMVGILHLVLFITYTVVLLSLAERHDSDWVWFGRLDSSLTSGWRNGVVSWNLGLLMPTWGFVGFDSAVHLGEEVRKARMVVPRVMFWTIVLNGALALVFCMTILYTAGDISLALAAPQPFLEICRQVTGSTPIATAMGAGLLVISTSVTLAGITSVSRLTWAWARDGALPSVFAHVSARHRVPVHAVLLSGALVMLLGILNIPTTVAFGAIIALASLALYTSYLIAIGCVFYARIADSVVLGQWNLGRWGFFVNLLALVYTLYIIIWLPFPTVLPVDGTNMNYSGPIFGAVLLLALAMWAVWGRRWPGVNVLVMEEAVKEQ